LALDGSVSGSGSWILVAWVLGLLVYSWTRYGMVPKHEHLRDAKDLPILAPWNLFSREKWTPEGIAFHRRVLLFSAKALLASVAIWLVLDLLT
jgi:hypothetical protein